jgi:hypothetical protein
VTGRGGCWCAGKEVLLRLKLTTTGRHAECKMVLERLASMLIKMAKNLQGSE